MIPSRRSSARPRRRFTGTRKTGAITIAAIKRYESMDFVADVKIVDIEEINLTTDEEDRA